MQRAARKVAEDNIRLRSLLALHGVLQEEVESYLRVTDEASISEAHLPTFQGSSVTRQCGTPERQLNHVFSPAESSNHTQSRYLGDGHTNVDSRFAPNQQKRSTARHSEIAEPYATLVRTELSLPKAADECNDMQGHSGSNDSIYVCPVTEPSGCPNTPSCFCAPAPTIGFHPVSSGLEISCETAATIIAEMRGDGDKESVRASLGCNGRGDCNIKNSTVLQIMDER